MDKIRLFITQFLGKLKYKCWFALEWIRENKRVFLKRLAVIALVLGAFFWIFLRTYHNYDVTNEIERKSDMAANYHFGEDGTLCYSKDGVSFTNAKGEVVWNQVFGMESPKMSSCGDYIAVGDIGANSVYVFDHNGLKGKLALEKPIQDLRISRQGVVAVILEDGSANQMNLYSKDGQMLVSIKVTIASGGYPLTMALSDDGTRLAVSYILFSGGRIKSKLVFYDFSNKETSGTPSGSFEYDELIPRLEFVEDNMVLACAETGFYTYQCGATVVQNHSQSFDGEVKSIFITDNRIGVVTKNPEVVKEGHTADKYKVQSYRFGGTKAGSFTFDFDYKAVNASDKDIVFYNDQECQIYSYRGHQKFQYEFEYKIDGVLPGSASGEYILLDQQSVKTITLK